MNIPLSVVQAINNNAGPLENNYFTHAIKSLQALNKVKEDDYCYDYTSNIINTLERLYKGFLKSASKFCEWYEPPGGIDGAFLTANHDLLGMLKEIKSSFPDVFPRTAREEWRETKKFLMDLRREYTSARYDTYPSFDEFKTIRDFVNGQYTLIKTYIENRGLEKTNEDELENDELNLDY